MLTEDVEFKLQPEEVVEGKWHRYSINPVVWNEFSAFISKVGKVE